MHHSDEARTLGRAVRAARQSRSLSQEGLSRRIGVTRTTVGRLERGEDVSTTTAIRALRACGMSLSAVPRRGWMSAEEYGDAIAEELSRGDHTFALRLVKQALEDLDFLADKQDQEALEQFSARAPSTKDLRWDRLLALAIGAVYERREMQGPSWIKGEPLEEPWFPTRPGRRFVARTVARTSQEFARANIWLDDRDLSYA